MLTHTIQKGSLVMILLGDALEVERVLDDARYPCDRVIDPSGGRESHCQRWTLVVLLAAPKSDDIVRVEVLRVDTPIRRVCVIDVVSARWRVMCRSWRRRRRLRHGRHGRRRWWAQS